MGEDRNRWLNGLPWLALSFALAVLLLIAALEASDEQSSWLASSLTTVPAVGLFGYVLSRTRGHLQAGELQRFRVRSFVLFGAIVATVFGCALLAAGGRGRNVRFVALTIVVLGVSHLLSEFRNIDTRRRGRAILLAVLCLSLSLGGVYWESAHPATGLLVAVAGAVFGYFALVTATEHMMTWWAQERTQQVAEQTQPDQKPDGEPTDPMPWWSRLWKVTGPWPVGGVFLLAASVAVFWSKGSTWWGVGTIVVLTLIVVSTISRGDFDLILVVLAVGMWWAVSPTTTAPNQMLLPPLVSPDSAIELESMPPSREGVLLVFGDSYISGEGASRYVAGTNERGKNECRRAETTHHYLLAQASQAYEADAEDLPGWFADLGPDAQKRITEFPGRVISVACSGAVAANIVATPQFEWQPPLRPGAATPPRSLTQIQLADKYLDATSSYVDTIMISIGGNDALFSTAVTTCLGPGDCSEIGQYFVDQLDLLAPPEWSALDQNGDAAQLANDAAVTGGLSQDEEVVAAGPMVSTPDRRPTVLDVYEQIRDHEWPEGPEPPRILVIPYPEPLAEDSCIQMLSQKEHLFVNDFVRQLNSRLYELSRESKLEFVHTAETALRADPDAELTDQLCGNRSGWRTALNQRGLNFLDFFPVGGELTSRISPLSWVHNSVHPNEVGHELLATAILDYERASPMPEGRKSTLEARCVSPVRDENSAEPDRAPAPESTGPSLPECYTGPTCRSQEVADLEPTATPTPAPSPVPQPTEPAVTTSTDEPAAIVDVDAGAADAPAGGATGLVSAANDEGGLDMQPDAVVAEPICTDPCDDTLQERTNPSDVRDDCPGTWTIGQLSNLAGGVYLPNLMAVLGAWMGGAWLMFRRENAKQDPGPNPDPDTNPDNPGPNNPGPNYPGTNDPGTGSAGPRFDALTNALVVMVVLFAAFIAAGAAKTVIVLLAAALFFHFIFKVLPRKVPPPSTQREPEPASARTARRRDPFEGEMRWWDRILREFRYQIIGWLGVGMFVGVVLFRAQNDVVSGVAAGVALPFVLAVALFPMVVSRPRQRSTQFALLAAVILLASLSGFIWPIVIGAANRADNGTIARDLPILAGGILALALLVASSIVDGAIRRRERASDDGSFLDGMIAGFKSLPDKGASELHSAQTITGAGLLVAAIAAKQLDGVEAYSIFALIVVGIVINWWALFMEHANRLWPFATLSVLAGIVSVELLWQDGWGHIGRTVMAMVALYVVAQAFSARILRLAAAVVVIFFGIGIYTIGTSVDLEAGETAPESFLDAIRDGLKEVWRSIFTSMGVDDPPPPGPVVFVGVLVVFVLAYRSLEVTNSRRTLTPVVVDDFTAPDSFKDTAALKSQLQSELARAGITEPAFVPTGGLPSQVITVFEGIDASTWTKAAQALTNLARPQRGTVVIPTLEEISSERAVVTIRVRHARTNRILYAASFHAEDPRTAVRKAVAFVARNTLGASVTTPAWARWESEDGLALRYYLESRSSSHYGTVISREDRINKLLTAISASPSTGLTRVELGHVHELEQRPWIALRVHLEAAHQHQRLVAAHYRTATGLSMIAGELLAGRTKPENVTMNNRIMIARGLEAVLDRHTNGDCDYFDPSLLLMEETTDQSRTDLAQAFLEAGDDIISGVLRITSTPVLLLNAVVHQGERAHWASLLRDTEAKRHETGRYLILRELIRVRLILSRAGEIGLKQHDREDRKLNENELKEIERWHRLVRTLLGDVDRLAKDYGGAGALYNHACLLAIYVRYIEDNTPTFSVLYETQLASEPGVDGGGEASGSNESAASQTAEAVLAERVSQAIADELEPIRLKAIELLYAARSHPGTGFPALEWVERDPDLTGLHGHPLFIQLKDWMRRGEEAIAEARNVKPFAATTEKT